jgi:ankyrin repeat protein
MPVISDRTSRRPERPWLLRTSLTLLAAIAGLLILAAISVHQEREARRKLAAAVELAFQRNDTDTAKHLLTEHEVLLDLNRSIPGGGPPLVIAAANDDEGLIQMLLAKGAAVDARGWHGETALIEAASRGRLSTVRILLLHGADLLTGDRSGRTPLVAASQTGRDAVVAELLKRGAKVDERDPNWGMTPLMWAAQFGHVGTVRLLLEHGANPGVRDDTGRTALSIARTDLAKALRRERADPTVQVPHAGLPEVIRLLRSATAHRPVAVQD